MNNTLKVLFLAIIVLSYVECITIKRNIRGSPYKTNHVQKYRNLNHHQTMFIQHPYDDYAQELAKDPFPTLTTSTKEKNDHHSHGEIIQEAPQFYPDDKENQQQILNESDSQALEDAFGGNSDLTQDDILDSQIESSENGQTIPEESETEQVAEGILSGGGLTQEVISDQMISSDDSQQQSELEQQATVGEGDYQSAQSAFGGDSTLTSTVIDQLGIESSENGNTSQSEVIEQMNEKQEDEVLLSGSGLTSEAIQDLSESNNSYKSSSETSNNENTENGELVQDNNVVGYQFAYKATTFQSNQDHATVGQGDNKSASYDFSGFPNLTQKDIEEINLQSYQSGQYVNPISEQDEQIEFDDKLTGSGLTENVITKLVNGEIEY